MTGVWALAALWLGLALIASLLSIWFRISTALSEIVVGTIAQLIIGAVIGQAVLGTDESWVKFLSGIGAIVLTFLAGAELDPAVFKLKWKEAVAVGLASFLFPFLGCAAAAYYVLGWEPMPSWLAGVAMSTTSVAVVYAVMLEFGFNRTEYGKTVLAACFITDLGTVVALGLIFAPFTLKTLVFLIVGAVVFFILPWLTPRFFRLYGNRPSELETKFQLFCLFGMGALATWADSEAVLPAYLIGMVLAGTVGKDQALIRRLRMLTFGFLTPFYFIRAGSFVSISALVAAPAAFPVFSGGQDRNKNRRGLSRNQAVLSAGQGGDVHHTPDVNRTDLRDNFRIIRAFARDYQPGPILVPGCDGHCERGHSDSDCKCVLSAASSIAIRFGANANRRGRRRGRAGRVGASRIAGACAMFKIILHANDGSNPASKALDLAIAMAKQNAAMLHLVCVEEIPQMPEYIEEVREAKAMAARRFHSVVERARLQAERNGVKIKVHIVSGHPVRVITNLLDEIGSDLLVIGATGHSALYERMIGSRADRIVQLAACPVLVVK
jgi:glutathione-regulated potassium-efflux system ancillary protein KefC